LVVERELMGQNKNSKIGKKINKGGRTMKREAQGSRAYLGRHVAKD